MIISSLAFEAYQALFGDLREAGATPLQLALHVGCSAAGAKVALQELIDARLAFRHRHVYRVVEDGPPSVRRRAEIEALLPGMTIPQVARHLSLSHDVVALVSKRMRRGARNRRPAPWRQAA